ncbi:MAG: 2-dehydropantoate 2-reductase, partial [candidate division NC10 bacterium]|nr:2-dehydropantoate 2-reductase [candidate division NC10 bacterium]
MKIAVMGSGGIGGYFGGLLAKAGEDVTFIARGAHLEAIRREGLRVRSAIEGEWVARPEAVAEVNGLPPADAVLLCVKAFDTEPALTGVRPVVGPETAVLTLQNGIDNVEKIDA